MSVGFYEGFKYEIGNVRVEHEAHLGAAEGEGWIGLSMNDSDGGPDAFVSVQLDVDEARQLATSLLRDIALIVDGAG